MPKSPSSAPSRKGCRSPSRKPVRSSGADRAHHGGPSDRSAADGETIVLGGLITKSTSTSSAKSLTWPMCRSSGNCSATTRTGDEARITDHPHALCDSRSGRQRTHQTTGNGPHELVLQRRARDSRRGRPVRYHLLRLCAHQVPAYYPDFDPQGVRPLSSPPGTEPLQPNGDGVPAVPRTAALFPPQPTNQMPQGGSSPSDQRGPASPEAAAGFVAPPDPRQENRNSVPMPPNR